MKLRFVLTALALGFTTLLTASRASAQVGVYLNPVVTHVGISSGDTGTYAFLGDNTTGRFFGGVDFGGYWNFYHQPKFAAGVDIRETTVHANNASLNTFSVAARIEGQPITHGLRPYGQLAIGAGRTKSPESIIKVTKAEWGIFAGVDYPISKVVDFRVVELGYGTVTTISTDQERGQNCTINASGTTVCTPVSGANLFNISSGLVFRFGGSK